MRIKEIAQRCHAAISALVVVVLAVLLVLGLSLTLFGCKLVWDKNHKEPTEPPVEQTTLPPEGSAGFASRQDSRAVSGRPLPLSPSFFGPQHIPAYRSNRNNGKKGHKNCRPYSEYRRR